MEWLFFATGVVIGASVATLIVATMFSEILKDQA